MFNDTQLEGGKIAPALLRQLCQGSAIHMDHYGGKRLPYACLTAQGISQRQLIRHGTSPDGWPWRIETALRKPCFAVSDGKCNPFELGRRRR